MKSSEVYLHHILDEINYLLEASKGIKFGQFLKDPTLQRAFVRSFEIMGEATKNLSSSFRTRHKEIDWKGIAGMRDRLIHQYFDVNWPVVWDTVKSELPGLKTKIEGLLEEKKK